MKISLRTLLTLALRAIKWFIILTVLWVLLYRFVPVPVTYLMVKRCVQQWWQGREVRLEKKWVPLQKISNEMQLAVVCAEDQRFLWHNGFDWDAMADALKYNRGQQSKSRKKVRGASTISQQTAKNVFLFPARNIFRKILEAYFTVLIELLWSKERILEVYLNVIEFGDGVYGVEAASQRYFKKPAAKLNSKEAARLAAVLPAPLRYSVDKPGAYVLRRQDHILHQMSLWGGRFDFSIKPTERKSL
ncbi:MAG: monofunctional biosynthetic peptidoglycan transglycosylase [Chitinophagales bacterium]|nr:monofunctional biosynthetic peptidoglycan transglycosylase [Chitinophagales bacterium]MDW8418030.1 monofunctional biosynthetic peptidoglycan transglycosylase [Chitinophagales bacterium]